jgi:hypothetical protein
MGSQRRTLCHGRIVGAGRLLQWVLEPLPALITYQRHQTILFEQRRQSRMALFEGVAARAWNALIPSTGNPVRDIRADLVLRRAPPLEITE